MAPFCCLHIIGFWLYGQFMIIKGGHDYYDTAGHGVDKTVVFDRTQNRVIDYKATADILEERMLYFSAVENGVMRRYYYTLKVGEEELIEGEYFALTVEYVPWKKICVIRLRRADNKYFFFHSFDEFKAYMWSSKKIAVKQEKMVWKMDRTSPVLGKSELTKAEELFMFKERITLAFSNKGGWDIDKPGARLYGIQHYYDASTLHQTIMSWKSCVLFADPVPMIEVTDEIKRDKHGFDKKSFKKRKKEKTK